jgi:hypothetical protein
VRPIFKTSIESLFDQQTPHARAVNEEIAFNGLAPFLCGVLMTLLHGIATICARFNQERTKN